VVFNECFAKVTLCATWSCFIQTRWRQIAETYFTGCGMTTMAHGA
jgi:hypothetical protein